MTSPLRSYTPIFIVATSAYFVALPVVHLLSPRMEPLRLEPSTS